MGNLNFKFRNLLFTFYLLSPLKMQIGVLLLKLSCVLVEIMARQTRSLTSYQISYHWISFDKYSPTLKIALSCSCSSCHYIGARLNGPTISGCSQGNKWKYLKRDYTRGQIQFAPCVVSYERGRHPNHANKDNGDIHYHPK